MTQDTVMDKVSSPLARVRCIVKCDPFDSIAYLQA